MSTALPTESSFAKILWPLLLGTVLSCSLFGTAVAQAIHYYRHYPNDKRRLKYFVGLLMLVEAVQTFGIVSAAKDIFLRRQVSFKYTAGISIHLYLTTVILAAVQSMYTYRVWIISDKNRYVTGFLIFLVFFGLVTSLALDTLQQMVGDGSRLHSHATDMLSICMIGAGLTLNVLISASLIYHLNKWRIGFRRIENLVDRIIVYLIGIGILTGVCAALIFITWLALPDKLVFMIFFSIFSKLHVNSLLVILNARRSFNQTR